MLNVAIPDTVKLMFIPNRIHITTYMIYLSFRLFKTMGFHFGYEFLFGPLNIFPYNANTDFNNYHHSTNIWNYVMKFICWGSILVTNDEYLKILREEMKNNLKGEIVYMKTDSKWIIINLKVL